MLNKLKKENLFKYYIVFEPELHKLAQARLGISLEISMFHQRLLRQ